MKIGQIQEEMKFISKITLYSGIASSLITLIICYLYGFRQYYKSSSEIEDLKTSMLVLPDELLSSNPFIVKFFNANSRILH